MFQVPMSSPHSTRKLGLPPAAVTCAAAARAAAGVLTRYGPEPVCGVARALRPSAGCGNAGGAVAFDRAAIATVPSPAASTIAPRIIQLFLGITFLLDSLPGVDGFPVGLHVDDGPAALRRLVESAHELTDVRRTVVRPFAIAVR